MEKLWIAALLLTSGISFAIGRFAYEEQPAEDGQAVETTEDGTYYLNQLGGRSNLKESVIDYGSDGTMDRWSIKAWEQDRVLPVISFTIADRDADGVMESYLALVEKIDSVEFGITLAGDVAGTPGPSGFSAWYEDKSKNIGARYYDLNFDGRFDRVALKPEGRVRVLIDNRWREVIEAKDNYNVTVELDGATRDFSFHDGKWTQSSTRGPAAEERN